MARPDSPLLPLLSSFDKDFTKLANKLVPAIERLLEVGVSPSVAVREAFRELKVSDIIRTDMIDNVAAAATLGYGVEVLSRPTVLRKTLLSKIWPGEELSLSARINKMEMRALIIDHIQAELKKTASVNALAVSIQEKGFVKAVLPAHIDNLISQVRRKIPDDKLLIKFMKQSRKKIERLSQAGAPTKALQAAYSELVDKIEKSGEKAVERAVENAVREKARFNAMRIARTELAKAHSLAHDFRGSLDPLVVGVKYRLSSRHRIYDICDYHTSVDLYNMGPGTYPKDKHPPHPFHPHCLCIPSSVFKSEADPGTFHVKHGENHLKKLSKSDQEMLFGIKGRLQFLKKPSTWETHLNSYQGQKKPDFGDLKKSIFE